MVLHFLSGLLLFVVSTLSYSQTEKTLPIVAAAYPLDEVPPAFTWGGYLHQAYVKTNSLNVGGESTTGSFENREVGLYGAYSLNNYIDFRGHYKWVQQGDRLLGNYPRWSFGFMDVHQRLETGIFGARLGHVRNEMGILNAVRDMPNLRDQDISPQAIYRDNLRDFTNGGKGFQVYYYTDALPYINLDVDYSKVATVMEPKADVLWAWVQVPLQGTTVGGSARVFNIMATTKDLKWKFRYDHFDIKAPYQRVSTDIFPSGDLGTLIEVFGVRRYFENWDVLYEYLKSTPSGDLLKALAIPNSDPRAHNIMFRYVPDENRTFYIGYTTWCTTNHQCNGKDLAAKTGNILPNYAFYYKDAYIGGKYRINSHWSAKAEYHKQRGLTAASPIDNPTLPFVPERNDLISVSVTYSF